MNHLTESQLNEYLDQVLSPADQATAQAHLDSCPECGAALVDLQRVFRLLGKVPEEALEHDLFPVLHEHLPSPGRLRPDGGLILIAQAGLALIAAVWLSASGAGLSSWRSMRIAASPPPLMLEQVWSGLQAWQADLFTRLMGLAEIPRLDLSRVALQPESAVWAVLLAVAGLACLLGNLSLARRWSGGRR
ncbi:MAG: zf-HC2 domain-containing protein [Anaerolineales bacterium]|nr:zf-HC2 domain-containing protein [Anaerolineales bacterium]